MENSHEGQFQIMQIRFLTAAFGFFVGMTLMMMMLGLACTAASSIITICANRGVQELPSCLLSRYQQIGVLNMQWQDLETQGNQIQGGQIAWMLMHRFFEGVQFRTSKPTAKHTTTHIIMTTTRGRMHCRRGVGVPRRHTFAKALYHGEMVRIGLYYQKYTVWC